MNHATPPSDGNGTSGPPNSKALWSVALSTIAGKIDRHSFDTWFGPVSIAGCDATALRLQVPNEYFRTWLMDAYGDLLRQTVAEVFGSGCELVIAAPGLNPSVASPAAMLPVVQAAALEKGSPGCNWLIERLWLAEAVGFLGSPPKHFKSWLAMEMAVSVASGAPCLGAFPVPTPGPVLLYAAEDTAPAVRQRLESLALHHRVELERLPLWVITADSLRLDQPDDRERLEATVAQYQPRLLILDPLIRLHQQDENASGPMAALLGFLRSLQRKAAVAIALIHHTRKMSTPSGAGYSLRGSSDFYAWTDVFLHLQRRHGRLTLTAEHRSAPPFGPVALDLVHSDDGHPHLALVAGDATTTPDPAGNSPPPGGLSTRILQILSESSEPRSVSDLRACLRVRNQRLIDSLRQLVGQGKIHRIDHGFAVLRPL
jgi:hypothetical protein